MECKEIGWLLIGPEEISKRDQLDIGSQRKGIEFLEGRNDIMFVL